jgi:hypothetical protein
METQNFEEKLLKMTKPEVNQLKHQDMLADAITNAKDKSVVSWWWLSVPLFIIAMLMMKSAFMPNTTLISNIHELKSKQPVSSLIFFLIVPVCIIIFNAWSIRKVWSLSDNPKDSNSIQSLWVNGLMIFLSIIVLIIYAL